MSNAKWYENSGRCPEIVLSSKAIMTRNIKGYKFPPRMTQKDKEEIRDNVCDALSDRDFKVWELDKISARERNELLDGQLMETKKAVPDPAGKAILTNEDMSTAVFINNQDHIRIRAHAAGFTDSVYKVCEDIACELEKKFDIAYSSKYGYLTCYVNDTGLALKLLYTVAIPGIIRTDDGLEYLKQKIEHYGWKMYPFVEDTADTRCDVYIIASNTSIGIDEGTLLDTGKKIVEEVVTIEKACRESLVKNNAAILENSYYRSYGILYYSKAMNPAEAMELIEWIRLYQGCEEKSEIKIDWKQINTITSFALWQLFPMLHFEGFKVDPLYVAARIGTVLRQDSIEGGN